MNNAYEKRKNSIRRPVLPLVIVGIACLMIGAGAGIAVRPAERIPIPIYNDNAVEFYTPVGSFYAIYAVQYMTCGSRIDRETALITRPENIIVFRSTDTYYPVQPVWSRSEHYLGDPYVILSGEDGDMYAARNIQRDERISRYDVIMTHKPDDIICPTPRPGS
jgi:hypothetical protein